LAHHRRPRRSGHDFADGDHLGWRDHRNFAASIAVAQNDIKRILAYSTVSQLGYMMMGLASAVWPSACSIHHARVFKALLFLVRFGHPRLSRRAGRAQNGRTEKIHAVTFAVYAVGMLALAGFPLFFSGFWSKDEILSFRAQLAGCRIFHFCWAAPRAFHAFT